MIEFKNIEFLWILLLIIPFILLIKTKKHTLGKIFKDDIFEKIQFKNTIMDKKTRSILLIISFVLMVIAFARPIINNGKIEVKSSFINMVVALDMSKSMFANDMYPNRFNFAKKKFTNMLSSLKNTKVSLIGFSSDTFLISPLTQDFNSLKFLTSNLNIENVSLKGTDIINTLKTANELMNDQNKKILFLFTDGSDKKDFTQELEYAKKNNITIYIYGVGTNKGGVIDTPNGALKDQNGNIVVVKLNENIKDLALKSGGAYMAGTLKTDDIKMLVDTIQSQFKAKDEDISTIADTKELFVIPLSVALLLIFISLFSLPILRGRK
jgi:Ca-activated chloride channel family protein